MNTYEFPNRTVAWDFMRHVDTLTDFIAGYPEKVIGKDLWTVKVCKKKAAK